MAMGDPRVEFRPDPELKAELQELRRRMTERVGRPISISELISAILKEWFSMAKV